MVTLHCKGQPTVRVICNCCNSRNAIKKTTSSADTGCLFILHPDTILPIQRTIYKSEYTFIYFDTFILKITNRISTTYIAVSHYSISMPLHKEIEYTLIARFMGPTWAHLGPTGPSCAPCCSHELCHLDDALLGFHLCYEFHIMN